MRLADSVLYDEVTAVIPLSTIPRVVLLPLGPLYLLANPLLLL